MTITKKQKTKVKRCVNSKSKHLVLAENSQRLRTAGMQDGLRFINSNHSSSNSNIMLMRWRNEGESNGTLQPRKPKHQLKIARRRTLTSVQSFVWMFMRDLRIRGAALLPLLPYEVMTPGGGGGARGRIGFVLRSRGGGAAFRSNR